MTLRIHARLRAVKSWMQFCSIAVKSFSNLTGKESPQQMRGFYTAAGHLKRSLPPATTYPHQLLNLSRPKKGKKNQTVLIVLALPQR